MKKKSPKQQLGFDFDALGEGVSAEAAANHRSGEPERVDRYEPESTSDRAELARSAGRSRAMAPNSGGFDMAPGAMLNLSGVAPHSSSSSEAGGAPTGDVQEAAKLLAPSSFDFDERSLSILGTSAESLAIDAAVKAVELVQSAQSRTPLSEAKDAFSNAPSSTQRDLLASRAAARSQQGRRERDDQTSREVLAAQGTERHDAAPLVERDLVAREAAARSGQAQQGSYAQASSGTFSSDASSKPPHATELPGQTKKDPASVNTDGTTPPHTSRQLEGTSAESGAADELFRADSSKAKAGDATRHLRVVPISAGDDDEAAEPDAEPQGLSTRLQLTEALRLERNLALLAGAGTGKTYNLVTMCLHLLGGARDGHEALTPDQLGLLTFTDKAAAEMRERLRRRLDALADGNAVEPELEASFTTQGKPLPPQRFWRTVRDDLGAATIGTFHSLCTQILRRAPAGSGVNPGFTLLDEREARELIRSVIEREVLRRIEANDSLIIDLVRELQFGSATEDGLVGGLMSVFIRLREEGSRPEYLRITDPLQARREFDAALLEAQTLTFDGIRKAWARKPKENEKAREFALMLSSTSYEQYLEDARVLQQLSGQLGHVPELKQARSFVSDVKGFENNFRRLDWLHAAVELAPYEGAIRDLLGEVMRLHEQALHTRGVLDFTGMLLQARNLLRDVPTARLEAQQRFAALLVDEFQDTNRVQLELVMLLAEKRNGAPRPISQSMESASQEVIELPLERAFLAVVGDRKQGIYEFRGADVTVFEEMARRIELSGGGRAWLQTSWRSSPALVSSLNALMLRVLAKEKFGKAPRAFEVVYTEQDHLEAKRGHIDTAPIVALTADLPEKADVETLRLHDADAVARYVRSRLAEGPLRGGHVAMLFQRFTQLELYRQALVRHGVRHRVVRGRGFFGAQEIVDLASWLKLLATPNDTVSLAAVLRSPLVGLRDETLVRLALPTRGLDAQAVLFDAALSLEGFSTAEAAKFERARSLYLALQAERDRLGLRALVRVTLETLEVREALAASPFGEQALANVDKLLELATIRQSSGSNVGEFAQELLQLADREPREAQGDVLDAYDLDAVTLCTVHQAKGLEWPVVVLPELFAPRRSDIELIWFDRNEGLAIRHFAMPETITGAARAKAIAKVRDARAFAENLRLLYVAMTRARDQVVLGVMPAKASEKMRTWADVLTHDSWSSWEKVHVDSLPSGALPIDPLTEPASADAEVAKVIERVRHGAPARPQEAVLPVTQLQDFLSCPRRFHFAHQVGLCERPRSFGGDDDGAGFEAPEGEPAGHVLDVRARGTAVHRLLELTPLDAVGSDGLMNVLRELRRAEDLPDDADESVLNWVNAFWSSPAGRRIAALGEARVLREVPFVLPLRSPEGDFTLHLRGQIDLVVDGPEGIEVIDYKTSKVPPSGLEPYSFQLGCYAVAAAALLGPRPLRAGVVFIRDEDRSPRFLPSLIEAAALRTELVSQARALTRSQVTRHFEGRPIEICRALGCGYVHRCHPGETN